MFKAVLLAGSMIVAAPALAQTAPASGQAVPGRTPMAADAAAPATDVQAQTAPAQAAPADPAVTIAQAQPAAPAADPATATAQTAPAQAAPADATNQPTQVAAIVDREFGAYDKDGDGKLSEPEFGAWMVALKTKADPTTKPDSPATKKWVNAAFAQADTDRNSGLTKTELTGFLSQGQS